MSAFLQGIFAAWLLVTIIVFIGMATSLSAIAKVLQ